MYEPTRMFFSTRRQGTLLGDAGGQPDANERKVGPKKHIKASLMISIYFL
jgi:hypothetical protein